MINKVKLKLSGSFYEITYGDNFSVKDDCGNHLVYEEKGIWHVISDPDGRKNSNSVITIPRDVQLHSFILEGTDIALKCDILKANTVYFDLKNSAGEISNLYGKKIGISMGKGEIRVGIKELDTLKIDCGYGTVNAEIPADTIPYNIRSSSGIGEVNLNSIKLPRQYVKNDNGKDINIVCGMGCVNINTFMR